jgi:CBS domain-containing protein
MPDLSAYTVSDYMTTKLVTFKPDTDMMSAIGTLVKRGHSGAPVCDDNGYLVGMLSEKDCLKVAVVANYEGVSPGVVRDFMSASVASLSPEMTLLDAATRFLDAPYKRFPVVESGRLVGQISRSDILRAIHDAT